jgi:hypothetical protein
MFLIIMDDGAFIPLPVCDVRNIPQTDEPAREIIS